LAYLAYARKLKSQEQKLESLPADERAKLADDYLTRYGIDGAKLKASDKFALIKDELDKRHKRSMTFAVLGASVFVVCFAIAVVAFVISYNRVDPPPVATRLAGPTWADLTQAPSYLRQNSRSFPAMQDAIEPVSVLADSSAGRFFCSDALLHDWTDATLRLKGIPKGAPALVWVYVFLPRGSNADDPEPRQGTAEGGVVTLRIPGRIPLGSVVFIVCSVADPLSTVLNAGRYEAFFE
jgi:hypothetical protein